MSSGQLFRSDDEEDFLLEDDASVTDKAKTKDHHWRLLVVDDDEAIHTSTRFVLSDFEYNGETLNLLHAYSADEAKAYLAENDDIAVMLLDVVMETDDAGLRLIDYVRNELNNKEIRIILRTGQPGVAPEWEVITKYDINDYKTKTELTQEKLFTTITTALRSFEQLFEINTNRSGLERIVEGAADLMQLRDADQYVSAFSAQLLDFLPASGDYLVATDWNDGEDGILAFAGGGRFADSRGELSQIGDIGEAQTQIEACFESRGHVYGEGQICVYVETQHDRRLVVWAALERPLGPSEQRLLKVFCANAAVGLDNVDLYQHVTNLAFQDHLTKLGNRAYFLEKLRSVLAASSDDDKFAVIDVDLDHFDDINDLVGQENGDLVLQSFADHLRGIGSESIAVCRISGDEFGMIYKVAGEDAVAFEPGEIQTSLQHEVNVAAYDIPIHSTLGITLVDGASREGETSESLMRKAWLALRNAKEQGRDTFAFYTPDMGQEVIRRAEMVSDIRQAIEAEEFILYYQPVVRVSDAKPVAFEALMRWRKKDGSIIPPGLFIPEMERSGLMIPAGHWALREACRQAKEWRDQGLCELPVSVNVSMDQIYQGDFPQTVAAVLEETQLPAKQLKLELTESVIMADVEEALDVLQQLSKIGVTLAIDDFGTGYSSLSYLQRLNVDVLKVDRSFITNMARRSGDAVIVEAIITLAHNFGMRVIAEGVEIKEQVDFLAALKCDEIQGYYYSKPLPKEKVEEFIHKS